MTHENIVLWHQGFQIRIGYWRKSDRRENIVSWSIHDGGDTVRPPVYIKEEDTQFTELIVRAAEEAVSWMDEHQGEIHPPDPSDVVETLKQKGYDAGTLDDAEERWAKNYEPRYD